MPRAIARTDAAPGIASYTLGGIESFDLLTLTVLVDASAQNNDDPTFFEARDNYGALIHRQRIGWQDSVIPLTLYSLAFGASRTDWSGSGATAYKEGAFDVGTTWPFRTVAIPPLSLAPACSVMVYCPNGVPTPGDDPLADLDTGVVVSRLYLWVEDTGDAAAPAPVELPAALAYTPTA